MIMSGVFWKRLVEWTGENSRRKIRFGCLGPRSLIVESCGSHLDYSEQPLSEVCDEADPEWGLCEVLHSCLGMANGDNIKLRRHALPHVETYDVTSDELERIETESKTVGQDFQYASNCLTAAVAFAIALFTTEIKSERVFDVFVLLAVSGSVFGCYFGQKYFRGRKQCATVIQKIRERQIGPIGEEGRELRPAEVAQLNPIAAPEPPPLPPLDQAADVQPQEAEHKP